jgi:YbbR domain-containing protein
MAIRPFRHLGLKVLAVGLATGLWLAVVGERTVERSLRVPLEFENIPSALEIVGSVPAAVDVRVRGASSALSRLQPGDVVAILDLTGARPGSRLFHLRTDQVRAPFGVEVTQVVPATVPLELERVGRRVVPIVPAIEGTPAPGFVLGAVQVEPPTVEVVGPESRVAQLASATTEPVVVEGATAPVKDVVNVGVADAALRLREPRTAVVHVEVRRAPTSRDLTGVPVALRHLAAGRRAEVTPAVVSLRVVGDAPETARPGTMAVTAFVDLAGLGPGRYNLPVRVDAPRELGVVDVRPPTVTVKIR